jgi:hypothetical protein
MDANPSLKFKSNSAQATFLIFNHTLLVNLGIEITRIMALIVSLVNMRVLASIRSNFIVYKLFAVMAFVDSFYLIALFLIRMAEIACQGNPNEHCPTVHYALYICYIWISDYLTSCLACFNILLEIFITIERLFTVSNQLPTMKNNTKVKIIILAILIISLSVYLPVLFMKRVEMKLDQGPDVEIEQYGLVKTDFGKSEAATIIINTLSILRVLLVSVVLFVLNLVTVFRFKRFLKRRNRRLDSTRSDFFSIIFL